MSKITEQKSRAQVRAQFGAIAKRALEDAAAVKCSPEQLVAGLEVVQLHVGERIAELLAAATPAEPIAYNKVVELVVPDAQAPAASRPTDAEAYEQGHRFKVFVPGAETESLTYAPDEETRDEVVALFREWGEDPRVETLQAPAAEPAPEGK